MKINITEFVETEDYVTRLGSEDSLKRFQEEFPVSSFVWYTVGQNTSFGVIKKYEKKVRYDDDEIVTRIDVNMTVTLRKINVYTNSSCDVDLPLITNYNFIKHATLEEIEAYETEQIIRRIEDIKKNIKLGKDNLKYYKKKLKELDKIIKNNL
jgi:hypothetical protein